MTAIHLPTSAKYRKVTGEWYSSIDHPHTRIHVTSRISPSAIIADHAYIGPHCAVLEHARVDGRARIEHKQGSCQSPSIEGCSYVGHNAIVRGNARVYGTSRISDNAIVEDAAWVRDSDVSGHGRVYGEARVYNLSRCGERATIGGHAVINNSEVRDAARVCDYAWMSDSMASGRAILDKGSRAENAEVVGWLHGTAPVLVGLCAWTIRMVSFDTIRVGCQHHRIATWLSDSSTKILWKLYTSQQEKEGIQRAIRAIVERAEKLDTWSSLFSAPKKRTAK